MDSISWRPGAFLKMIAGLLIIALGGFAANLIVNAVREKHVFVDGVFLKRLYYYHVSLSLVYYIYVLFSPSDSRAYYRSAFVTEDWLSLYGTSTTFIKFVNYPFVAYGGFSYEAMMALFSFLGYIGFIFMYVFFKENIRFKHKFFRVDLLTLIFLLPNLHFWSGSLGKGSIIFLGIGLLFFGLGKPSKRVVPLLLGSLIVYHVRPHVMLMILVSSAAGFLFSSKGVSLAARALFLLGAVGAFFVIYQDVLTLVGIDEEEFLSQGLDLSHRAAELSKATSGVDITNYSLPLQVFTFLYRPLFFDAPGMLGIVVSFENVFYILFSFNLFRLAGVKYLLRSNSLVKSAALSFVTVSIALAQISGNLGLAIRQKSQVMILFLFVILMFLDDQKYQRWIAYTREKGRRMTGKKATIPQ